jgi:putative salt-induced outer membrane protein YdiY
VLLLLSATAAIAQEPPPPKHWTTSASAGLTVTSGNRDTSTVNAGYGITYDPKTTNIFKSDGLFIRGTTGSEVTTNRLGLNARLEHRVDGFFLFVQNQYLRDRFKQIDYLVAPTAGIGVTPVKTDETELTLTLGAGGAMEKNLDLPLKKSGAITAGESFTHALSDSVSIGQSISSLWTVDDFGDALYTVGANLATSITARTQLKIEWLDTYKRKPPAATIKKNDLSMLLAIVFKY